MLTRLINQSLVVVEREGEGEARSRMLETIRQYAREKLAASGEADAVRERHLHFYLQLAEQGEIGLRGAGQQAWLQRLSVEQDNVRAALEFALASRAPEHAEAGLRLVVAQSFFWFVRGSMQERRDWLTKLLASPHQPLRTVARARALSLMATATTGARQAELFAESQALCRELNDRWGLALSLYVRGATA